jgi:outer membrane murein-binding lipoprotein Lpp
MKIISILAIIIGLTVLSGCDNQSVEQQQIDKSDKAKSMGSGNKPLPQKGSTLGGL